MSESIDPVEVADGKSAIEVAGESVEVRMLPIKAYERLAQCLLAEDEGELVVMYTGKSREWVDNLKPMDHIRIVEEGERLNLDPFGSWLNRRQRMRELVFPGYKELLLQFATADQKTKGPELVSRDGSRRLPLSVAGPTPR